MGLFHRIAAGSILAGFLLLAPGCARVSQADATTVISHSRVSLLAIFAIGMTMVLFGVGIARESMEAARPKKRKKGAAKTKAKPRRPIGTYFGVALTIAGLLILLLGVPSAYVAKVTVHPDRVVFRDALFWWANEPREFNYAHLTGIDIEVVEMPIRRRGQKDQEYLVLSGMLSQDRREMNLLLRAAHPILLTTWQQYHADHANVAAAEPAPGLPASSTAPMQSSLDAIATELPADAPERTTPSPAPPGQVAGGSSLRSSQNAMPNRPGGVTEVAAEPPGTLTPVETIGRFRAGVFVMVPRNGTYTRAEVLEVYQEQQIRIRYDGDKSNDVATIPLVDAKPAASARLARPGEGPGREITDVSEVRPGMTLWGHYDGHWTKVEVLEVSSRRITIRWPGERIRERVPLSWLRIPAG
ncbi:MAG: hypothetical protein ACF8TS_00355 [Maioricimonas sp. JB049]